MFGKKEVPKGPIKHAILDVDGANCSSCVYTIEHVGSKLKGVHECFVDRNSSQIQLDYDGNPETLDRIVELVDRIGYTAVVNQADMAAQG